MVWQEILGFFRGALISGAMIPQVWRLFNLKSAHEISLPFTWLFLCGTLFWLSYRILLGLPPVIFWNGITLVSAVAMLYAKLKYT